MDSKRLHVGHDFTNFFRMSAEDSLESPEQGAVGSVECPGLSIAIVVRGDALFTWVISHLPNAFWFKVNVSPTVLAGNTLCHL